MKEIGVALIGGGGFMGRAHSLAWDMASQAEDIGARAVKRVLVDVDPAVAQSAASQLGWAEAATDWRQVLVRDDIDAVDIVTPPQFHVEIALAAMAAGKHVFCEKPVSNDLDEALSLVDAARNAAVVAQVGFNYRHTPAIAYGKQLLDSGRLGRVLEFRGSYLNESAYTGAPDRWRASRARGSSGAVGDIGSHIIDIAQFLVGNITRVSAITRTRIPGESTQWIPGEELGAHPDLTDHTGLWLAEFESGAIGSFSVSQFASGRKNKIEFGLDAEEGAIDFDWNSREEFRVSYVDEPGDHQGFRTIHTNNQHPNSWWRLAGIGVGYLDISAVQFQAFMRSIADGVAVTPSVVEATQVQAVVEAVYESARSGEWVTVRDVAKGLST